MNYENIFNQLRVDHDKQRKLMSSLVKTQGESKERSELFKSLKEQLDEHAKMEERFLYSQLMKHDITMEKARHSVHEHHEIDEKLEEIESLSMDSPEWLKKVKELKHLVSHHLEEEEQQVFQLAGKALNESEKKSLGKEYADSMDEVRA